MAHKVDQLLKALVHFKGSDLHLSASNPPMVRVDGKLKRLKMAALTDQDVRGMLHEVMLPKHRDEMDADLDSDFAYQVDGIGRFRVATLHQNNGWSGVFRVIPSRIPTASELLLPEAVQDLARKHKGLVVITGATGSGKSTTLAALVDAINSQRSAHIVTLEDPIEFVHESKQCLVTQREIGKHARDFARGLRAALREDPDVILVGEMRDVETMQLALTAAETGHLVLATLHTNSAVKAIDRIIDSFPGAQQDQVRTQLSETIEGIVAQTLLPRKDRKGRIAAFEVLIRTSAVANLIREKKPHMLPSTMQSSGSKVGMQRMDTALLELVRRGLISERDALTKAHDRQQLEKGLRKLQGS